jgi:hypothetical protein
MSLAQDDSSGQNCSFRSDPESFRSAAIRSHRLIGERIQTLDRALKTSSAAAAATEPHLGDSVDPLSHSRHNFIDDEIFNRLAAVGVAAAPLSTDEEFMRRLSLDLTGRIPSPADVRAFVADSSPTKRNALIDKLIYSSEFNDKWTMWLGDLLQNNIQSVNVTRNTNARNALHKFIAQSVSDSMSIRDMFYLLVGATGNSYDGPSAFILNGTAPGGPKEDRFDMMLYKSASTFLGLGHYDCLLCHNGRGHLDSLSLWGSRSSRTEAERMAAFFSKTNFTGYTFPAGTTAAEQQASFYNGSQNVDDVRTGTYALPSTYGNRPNRPMLPGNVRAVDPAYRDGTPAKSVFWRNEFADNMIRDPLFYINFANRLWKQMFNYGLVDQVDQLDPDRLDPDNPPPAPWTLQATHPALLVKLAKAFQDSNASMREVLRLIAESSAYQLSSRYNNPWTPDMVPLFARHYPRRLEGEEIHDAIVAATGVFTNYTVAGWTNTVKWAMQLPDSQEPRTTTANVTAANFMNNFLRGNRDTVPRSQLTSIVQSAALMNDTFVNSKFHMTQSPTLQAIAKLPTPVAQLEEIYLTFLGRLPSDYERANALPFLSKATTTAQKNAALEDLAWTMINKLDFVFSY